MAASLRATQLKSRLCTEDFIYAIVTVIFGVCNPVRLLELLAVTIRKWSPNPVSSPEPRREPL
jgi:hypothetical protein